MTIRVNKPSFNIREKLSELGRKFGLKGSELAAAETVQEARDVVSAGRKNMIINGAMRVAQRVAYPNTQPGILYSNYYTVDRWRFNVQDTQFGTWTLSQSNTVPSGKGFAYSWKWDCTTADTSLGSGHYGIAEYRMEAQDLQHLEYGTSSARPVTISFWVKTNKTGTYVFSIFSEDGNRYVSKSYTVNQANTWEYKTITFEGDTSGTINNDTGDGFRLWWWLGAGSSFTSGTMQPGVWRSFSSAQSSTAADLNVNMADSTSNEWFITGVQMEVGRNATEFEHRSYGEELALCQRYYQKIVNSSGNASRTVMLGGYNNTRAFGGLPLSVPLRTSTIAFSYNNLVIELINLSNSFSVTSIGRYGAMGEGGAFMGIEANASSGITGGTIYYLTFQGTGSYLALDAEL